MIVDVRELAEAVLDYLFVNFASSLLLRESSFGVLNAEVTLHAHFLGGSLLSCPTDCVVQAKGFP